MANRRFIDFPIAASVGDNDIVLIWQDGLNKQTTKATLLQGSPQSLAGLTDVDIAGLTNGQILQYNSTLGKWENVDRTDINLSELGDVTIVAPTNGQVLVYNSSTSKWENSSGGYVPYTGAVTTVNLGAQSILAGTFVKAGGTSSQFLKADGSVDSSTYGTGTVTSVALTMPTAFSVGGSPITTAGTLAVTATGTTSQYIRGDGSLATFPGLTGFVPYTGATADVNLGTHDLAAERGTFANNGSSDTLTVNHTSGSGYGIIVTKGGSNEALYVSKTSGSGNAMTVVGGRTSLVDLALSSVSNTAGDFLTISGGVVHKRTAAQTLTDIGGQAALTNPVTGTGTTNYLPKFTGASTIGNSNLYDGGVTISNENPTAGQFAWQFNGNTTTGQSFGASVVAGTNSSDISFRVLNASASSTYFTINGSGNLLVGTTTDNGARLQVSGRINAAGGGSNGVLVSSNSGSVTIPTTGLSLSTGFNVGYIQNFNGGNYVDLYYGASRHIFDGGNVGIGTSSPSAALNVSGINVGAAIDWTNTTSSTGRSFRWVSLNSGGFAIEDLTASGTERMRIASTGNVLIGTTTDNGEKLQVNGEITAVTRIRINKTTQSNQIFGDGNAFNISGSNNLGIRNDSGSIVFASGGANVQMLLNSSGNVGIGTTSPSEKLHVANNGTGAYSAALWTNSNSTANLYVGVGGSGVANTGLQNNAYVLNAAASALVLGTSDTERMRITSGGNVLVGTTTDSGYKLDVAGQIRSFSDNPLVLSMTSNPSNDAVVAARWTSGTGMEIRYLPDFAYGYVQNTYQATSGQPYGDIYFRQNVGGTMTTRMAIKADGGNVGIGTSSPTVLLQLNTADTVNNIFRITNGTQILNFGVNNSSGGSFIFESAAQALRFGTSDTERARITSGGNVLIGTTTDVGAKLYVNGGIRTANPTGSTSNDWLLGRALTSGTSSPDRWIRVQIGNLYYDILAVYMGSV
jgi:hypothetical protein